MTDSPLKATPVAILSASPDKRLYVKDALHQLGFEKIRTYSRPIELWSQIEKKAPDLILTEYRNHFAGDGLELISQVRKDPKNLRVGCIIMSSKVDKAHVSSSIESDVDEFLALPFSTTAIQESALRALQKRLHPTPYMKSLQSATFHLHERRYPEAQRDLVVATNQNPTPATAHYYLGFIQMVHQQIDQAMDFFERGLKSHPFHLKCLLGRAFLYKRLGQTDSLRESLDRILELQPCHPQSNQERIQLSVRLGDFRDCLNRVQQLLIFRKDFPKLNDVLLATLPEILETTHQKVPALYSTLSKRIRDIRPSSHEFAETMILKLASLGSFIDARNLFQDYRKYFSPNAVFEIRWIMELVKQNAFKEALQACYLFKIQFGDTDEVLRLEKLCHQKITI